jgi:hypothetical protein
LGDTTISGAYHHAHEDKISASLWTYFPSVDVFNSVNRRRSDDQFSSTNLMQLTWRSQVTALITQIEIESGSGLGIFQRRVAEIEQSWQSFREVHRLVDDYSGFCDSISGSRLHISSRLISIDSIEYHCAALYSTMSPFIGSQLISCYSSWQSFLSFSSFARDRCLLSCNSANCPS